MRAAMINDIPAKSTLRSPVMTALFCAFFVMLSAAPSFAADDKGFVPLRTTPITTSFANTQGLNFNLASGSSSLSPILSSGGIYTGAVPNLSLDLDTTGVGPSAAGKTGIGLFDMEVNALNCLAGDASCLTGNQPKLDLGFSKIISKTKPGGLDVELVPSASVRFDSGEQSALVGAVVRIGDDLRSRDVSSNTWYVFAGADAEALAYTPVRSARGLQSEFMLQDRIIIGDAQAGIGYRMGDADLSLGYFRREVSGLSEAPGTNFSTSQDAAAISFTWKR